MLARDKLHRGPSGEPQWAQVVKLHPGKGVVEIRHFDRKGVALKGMPRMRREEDLEFLPIPREGDKNRLRVRLQIPQNIDSNLYSQLLQTPTYVNCKVFPQYAKDYDGSLRLMVDAKELEKTLEEECKIDKDHSSFGYIKDELEEKFKKVKFIPNNFELDNTGYEPVSSARIQDIVGEQLQISLIFGTHKRNCR